MAGMFLKDGNGRYVESKVNKEKIYFVYKHSVLLTFFILPNRQTNKIISN